MCIHYILYLIAFPFCTLFQGKTILRCNLECMKGYKSRIHWHCCYCPLIFTREGKIYKHLERHLRPLKKETTLRPLPVSEHDVSRKDLPSEQPINNLPSLELKGESVRCNECKKVYPTKASLQRHVREQHKRKVQGLIHAGRYLDGVSVDVQRGIFLVSRAFSGTRQPIHCQHATGEASEPVSTACELDDCRNAAMVASNSGQPSFECVHLRSIQYSRPFECPNRLVDYTLEELAGGKVRWFKDSMKMECLNHRNAAEIGNYPLLVASKPFEGADMSSNRFSKKKAI